YVRRLDRQWTSRAHILRDHCRPSRLDREASCQMLGSQRERILTVAVKANAGKRCECGTPQLPVKGCGTGVAGMVLAIKGHVHETVGGQRLADGVVPAIC